MSDEVTPITFESIYNLVRNEKTNVAIQKINPMIYAQLVEYLKTKIQTYKESKQKQINPQDIEKIKFQITSARKLIKDFYEYRERKITTIAIDNSRTKNADVKNLLDTEKEILNQITQILDVYRKDILLNLVNAKVPYQNQPIIKRPVVTSEIEEESPKKIDESNEPEKPVKSTDVSTNDTLINIKFIKEVPKFLGKNSEVFGPFAPDDEIKIDIDIANILINQNHAIKLN
jgi:hypothetical protein